VGVCFKIAQIGFYFIKILKINNLIPINRLNYAYNILKYTESFLKKNFFVEIIMFEM